MKVQNVAKSYGPETILQNVSFVLNREERLGLIGPNGSGKSTLLQILSSLIEPDTGTVQLDAHEHVAYLPQYPMDDLSLSMRESILHGAGQSGDLQTRISCLEHALGTATGKEVEQLLTVYAEAREAFEAIGGYSLESRIEQVVDGLGLDASRLDSPVSTLSGGNKTKLSLARLLLSNAEILLLDEPTNFLDLPAVLWLERFIMQSGRACIIVSHDRRFLDRTVSGILELDPIAHTLREWPGNYSAHAEARLHEELKRLAAYRDQQEEIKRIEEDIRRTKEQAQRVERQTNNDVLRRYARKVARKATVRERRLQRHLQSEEQIEKPVRGWGLHLVDLGRDPIDDARIVLEARGLRAGYDGQEVVHGVDLLIRGHDRVALLGENGSGKSTLVRRLTGSLAGEGELRLGASIRVGLLSQEADELPPDRTVLDLFRSATEMYEGEARAYLHKFLFGGEEVLKPVRILSYGQRARLALAMLILSDANFLILDEPTSHLDMPALEAVERALALYSGPLLLVSHDRYFLERVGINRVEIMRAGRLHAVESIEQYEAEILDGIA